MKAGDACPKCHIGVMVERVVKRAGSKRYGRTFIGCNRFPDCRKAVWTDTGATETAVEDEHIIEPIETVHHTGDSVPNDSTKATPEKVASMLADLLRNPAIDEPAVRRIATSIAAEVSSRNVLDLEKRIGETRKVEIEVTRIDQTIVTVKDAHMYLPRLLKLLGAGIDVYLWGPPGSGKTTAALQAAEALGHGGEIDTLDPSTFRSMIQGYTTPNGEPVHTVFTRCWSDGKLYIADEADNAPGHVQTLFNSALANGHAPLAWGNVAKSTGFGFVGTGNTPGRPTRQFPDRKPMSAAFADRLYFMHWPLDAAIECRIGGLPIPSMPNKPVRKVSTSDWVQWVRNVRVYCDANAPTVQVTPRASITGIKALALGEAPEDVADALVFRGCDAELRTKILHNVRLP